MTKGSRMIGAVIGATLAVAGAWYILNHQAAIRAWFQNLGKSLAPTPSTDSGGGTPPAKTAPSAAAPPSATHPSTKPVPIVHPTYPTPPLSLHDQGTNVQPPNAGAIHPSSPSTTNKIHPTTHTPPLLHPQPVTVHHVSPPVQQQQQKPPKTPKQVRCTNPKSCNGTSCCHVKCEDIDTCYTPCGWSKDDYNRFLASCLQVVNITK